MKLLAFLDRNAGKLLLVGVITYGLLFAVSVVRIVWPELTWRLYSCVLVRENPGFAQDCSIVNIYLAVQVLFTLLGGMGWSGAFSDTSFDMQADRP